MERRRVGLPVGEDAAAAVAQGGQLVLAEAVAGSAGRDGHAGGQVPVPGRVRGRGRLGGRVRPGEVAEEPRHRRQEEHVVHTIVQ